MKKLTAALALASSFSAFSSDLILGDLNFFQKKNAALVSTSLNYSFSQFEEVSAFSGSNDYRASAVNFTNSLSYGLSDQTNVGLAVDYALRNRTYHEDTPGGGSNDLRTQEEGLSDFTILGNHRLRDENIFVDVVSGLTLGLGNKERAFGTPGISEGNNYQGNHSLSLGVATGQKREDNWEWRGFADFDYQFAGDGDLIDDDIASTSYDSDGMLNWKLGGALQYRTNYNWALTAGLDYTLVDRLRLDTGSANTDLELESDNFFTLGFGGKYNVSDFILINLGYELTPRYDISVERANAKFTQENGLGHRLTAGAQVLF